MNALILLLSLRAKIKEFLNVNENKYPGIKNNIMNSFQKILDFDSNISTNLKQCRRCGEPTSSDICKACEILDLISHNSKKIIYIINNIMRIIPSFLLKSLI